MIATNTPEIPATISSRKLCYRKSFWDVIRKESVEITFLDLQNALAIGEQHELSFLRDVRVTRLRSIVKRKAIAVDIKHFKRPMCVFGDIDPLVSR